MAAATAGAAVLLGSLRLLEGVESGELQVWRLLVVFAVVFLGLTMYRWMNQKRIERDSEALRREAENQLLGAKDQFIGNISHGLRTPLTGIVGFSHLLQQSVKGSDDREWVATILGEAAELSRITDDLLIAARLDADVLDIQPENVAVVPQVREVVEFMALVGAQVELDLQEATVWVDPERFRQILRNLLVNAHRHGRPQVIVQGRVRHGRYVCHVIDHGSGVPSELQGKLFERVPYRPTARLTGHAGLGLSVVQELCRQMGVEVGYRRIRGQTHFVTSLPLGSDTEPTPEPADESNRRTVRFPTHLTRPKTHDVPVSQ